MYYHLSILSVFVLFLLSPLIPIFSLLNCDWFSNERLAFLFWAYLKLIETIKPTCHRSVCSLFRSAPIHKWHKNNNNNDRKNSWSVSKLFISLSLSVCVFFHLLLTSFGAASMHRKKLGCGKSTWQRKTSEYVYVCVCVYMCAAVQI